jgi:hypothetical protein
MKEYSNVITWAKVIMASQLEVVISWHYGDHYIVCKI